MKDISFTKFVEQVSSKIEPTKHQTMLISLLQQFKEGDKLVYSRKRERYEVMARIIGAEKTDEENRQELERKADLTMLVAMEETAEDTRQVFAAAIGLPWDEYLRLKQKYRFVLKRYREEGVLDDSQSGS